MSTDIKSSSTVTQPGVIPGVKGEGKTQPKAAAQHGIYEDVAIRNENEAILYGLAGRSEGEDAQGGLPPNGTFSLWQMLMAIMKYEKNNLDNNAEMQKNYAENLGGANGVFAKLYDVGCMVGIRDADSLKADAYGKFAQAGVSGTSLVVSGTKYLASTRPEINAGGAAVKDNEAMDATLNKSGAGLKISEKSPVEGPLTEKDQVEVDKRIQGWADGSRSVNNFKGADAEDARLNKLAAEHASNDNKAKIQKQINKAKTSNQNRINTAETNFNSFQQTSQQVTSALNNGAAGGAAIAQANSLEDKGKYAAQQTVLSQAQQGLTAAENTSEKQAQDALQQANQWAAGFAQAASAQVHA
jgi:hypothetical protein